MTPLRQRNSNYQPKSTVSIKRESDHVCLDKISNLVLFEAQTLNLFVLSSWGEVGVSVRDFDGSDGGDVSCEGDTGCW